MNNIDLNVEQKNGVITVNFEEIKEQLAAGLEEYRGMVFTEDSKTEAKKTVSSLRKLKKAISDRRIEVKKSFMQPYTEFEAQVKELDKLIDEPINFINEQVAEFERKRVEERKEEIRKIYLESIDGMDDYLPLSSIYDQKWENATTSKKCIKEEIVESVKAVKQELEVIKGMQTDAVDNALAFYKRTLSLADTMHYVNEWEKQKAEILKKQEVEKVREEKPEQNTEPVQISTTSGREQLQQEVEKLTGTVTYEIHADPFQIAQIEAAMRKYGIEYRRI